MARAHPSKAGTPLELTENCQENLLYEALCPLVLSTSATIPCNTLHAIPNPRILLGSVKRAELISAIEDVISKERRLAVVAERRREEDKRRLERQQRELTDKLKKLEDRKKPSRYIEWRWKK